MASIETWCPGTMHLEHCHMSVWFCLHCRSRELGEILLPVLSPFSSQHPDDQVRLGRTTVWEEDEDGQVLPAGQKMLVADEEEFPFLELRQLHFDAPAASAAQAVN